MPKFSFVVLHYNTIDDTDACVESIENMCKNSDYRIYIVDNASPNMSGKKLEKKYCQIECIKVILSKENLGFAKGNNLGIDCAMNDGYADFIVVLNSDTKVIQPDFCEKIVAEYGKSEFAVLGPTIYTPHGKTAANPGRTYIRQGSELDEFVKRYRRKFFMLKTGLCFVTDLFKKKKDVPNQAKSEVQFRYTENCVLHGCFLVFSRKYLDVMQGFDSRTFLYFEEEILYLHCMKNGLKTVYSPEIEIWHKEDGATDSILDSSRKKMIFICKNVLKSVSVYRRILEEYSKKI